MTTLREIVAKALYEQVARLSHHAIFTPPWEELTSGKEPWLALDYVERLVEEIQGSATTVESPEIERALRALTPITYAYRYGDGVRFGPGGEK